MEAGGRSGSDADMADAEDGQGTSAATASAADADEGWEAVDQVCASCSPSHRRRCDGVRMLSCVHMVA